PSLVSLLPLSLAGTAGAGVEKRAWGEFEGAPVTLYTLTNGKNMTLRVADYGATLVGIDVPDRSGRGGEVTRGFDDLKGSLEHRFIGSTVGRYGNRIAKG